MSDTIQDRLRGPIKHPQECINQRQEAADHIDALEAELNAPFCDEYTALKVKHDALEAELADLKRRTPDPVYLTGFEHESAVQRRIEVEVERLRAALQDVKTSIEEGGGGGVDCTVWMTTTVNETVCDHIEAALHTSDKPREDTNE